MVCETLETDEFERFILLNGEKKKVRTKSCSKYELKESFLVAVLKLGHCTMQSPTRIYSTLYMLICSVACSSARPL